MVAALSQSPLTSRHAFGRGRVGSRSGGRTGWRPAPPNHRRHTRGRAPRKATLTGVYDAWNRLVAAKDGSSFVAAYAYDGLRRRVIKKTYTGGTLKETRDFYFSDRWQVLSELVGGVVDKTYAWGLRYIDELLWRFDSTWKRIYTMQDANFNCTAICDTSGSVLERYQFDPYGNRVVLSPSWSAISVSVYDWAVAHQGLMLETDVGLYNCRNRVYSPLLGVWLQRDPSDYTDGANLYEYILSSPLIYTDPNGELTQQGGGDSASPISGCVPDGYTCMFSSKSLKGCISCCTYTTNGASATSLECASVCFSHNWDDPFITKPSSQSPSVQPHAWHADYGCKEMIQNLAYGEWGQHVDGNDKFQHCYTSCRLSQNCGRALSGFLGTLREHVSFIRGDSQEDLLANETGIYYAGHECKASGYREPDADCCKQACDQSYKSRGPRQIY